MKKIILLGDKKTTEIALRIIKKYFKKEINLNEKKFDNALLKDPFFLN